MGIFDVTRLYTLYRDPITVKKAETQEPSRPFHQWMEAVNEALLELLLQDAFEVDDAYLTDELGLIKDAEGRFILNDFEFGGSDVIRFSNTCDVIITGLVAGRPSQQVDILALGLGRVSIINQSTFSEEGNRLITVPRSQVDLAPGVGFARVYYDGLPFSIWRVILHEQGAPLTPDLEFTKTAFLADGGTWSVPDVSLITGNVFTYYLKGAMLQINLRLLQTDVSGNADRLRVELPLDYVAKRHMASLGFVRAPSFSPSGLATLWQSDFSSRDFNIEPMNGEKISGSPVDVLGQFWLEIGSQGGELGTGPSGGGSEGGGQPLPGGGTGGSMPPAASVPLPSQQSILATLNAYNATAGTTIHEISRDHGDPGYAWIDGAVEALRATDSRWGFVGQLGNVNRIGADVVAYYYGAGAPVNGALLCYVIDVVVGAEGPNPRVGYSDQTDYTGAVVAAWVYPRT